MIDSGDNKLRDKLLHYAPLFGVILVISGLLLLLDQRLKTGWISITIPLAIGIVFSFYGIFKRNIGWLAPGMILTGIGLALLLIFGKVISASLTALIGYSLLANAGIWLVLFVAILLLVRKIPWWSLFVITICATLGHIFLTEKFSLLVFVFYLACAIGSVFLLWGSVSGKLGLIIPGAILSATGAGVYFGWSNPDEPGQLQKTGIMLVWFALGWVLITVFSRIMKKRFVWWPLIPGGILLMVGSGLYIGGNPQNALGFLGNTGSIGLILVGAYLIFLKFSMKP
jgi:hypothetical protein